MKHFFKQNNIPLFILVIGMWMISISPLMAQIKFIGTTQFGGASGAGCIYTADTDGNVEEIHSFDRKGRSPIANSFTMMSNGNLLGITYSGGDRDHGTLYEFDLNNIEIIHRADLTNQLGQHPYGNMLKASDGFYYGFGVYGGIFRYNEIDSSTIKLTNATLGTGIRPVGTPVEVEPGVLLGLTNVGGANLKGTIFKYEIASNTATTLISLDDSTGYLARNELTIATSGLVYGLTSSGASNGKGAVLKYDYNTNQLTRLHSLEASTYFGPLVEADNGNLLGFTETGGAASWGTIFEISAATDSVKTIFEFNNSISTGRNPRCGLTKGVGDKFYGTTYLGGTANGVLYEFDYATKQQTILHNFVAANGDGNGQYNPVFVHPTNNKIYGLANSSGNII